MVLVLPGLRHSANAKRRRRVRIGLTLEGDVWVDPATARAGAKPLFNRLTRGVGVTLEMETFADAEEALTKLKAKQLDFVAGSVMSYIKLSERTKLVLVARAQISGRHTTRLVLLARRDSGVKKLSQLKGKSISVPAGKSIHDIFLQVRVGRLGVKPARSFFSAIQKKRRQQSAVLDVLMGEADSCLVSESVLKAMSALNPQIARQTVVVLKSESFSTFPLFARPDVPKDIFAMVKREALRLMNTKEGKQLFLIFKIDGMVPAREEDFRTARALWKEHKAGAGSKR